MKIRVVAIMAILAILVLFLTGCGSYGYPKGKEMTLDHVDFFKDVAVMCIDNQLQRPISLSEINSDEYDDLTHKEKKLLKKCVKLHVRDIYKDNQGILEHSNYDYLDIGFDTIFGYQGIIYVPKEFSEEDVENLLHRITSETVDDLTKLDDQLYYYHTVEGHEKTYSKEYTFPDGSIYD